MLNQKEILSTIEMIDQQHLDIRTITMGISLLSCCDPDPKRACEKIYDKITRYAEKLVKTGGKPIFMGFCCWVAIACVSLLVQHLLGIW
jgi:uncharacterized protein (UPF0210 family)